MKLHTGEHDMPASGKNGSTKPPTKETPSSKAKAVPSVKVKASAGAALRANRAAKVASALNHANRKTGLFSEK